jgi:putative oxidoreductase
MNATYRAVFDHLSQADWILPTLARLIFAATLCLYFWVSGLTKLGEGFAGIFNPSVGAYVQIFPRAMEAVSYDAAQLPMWYYVVALIGTWAEFLLPALIVIGLATRLSAVGMIIFIVVQSITDLVGHGGIAQEKTFGAWFDRFPDSTIMDQRTYWVFLLLVLVIKGAGPLSLDRAFRSSRTAD